MDTNSQTRKDASRARSKAWRAENLEQVRAKDRARINPEENRRKVREWAAKNPEKAKLQSLATYQNDKDKAKKRARAWSLKNPERRREIANRSAASRRARNPVAFREATKRRRSDPSYRLNASVSTRVRIALKSGKGGRGWESIVGYSLQQLIEHLRNLLTDGMTFENYGEWHIDHIRPVASFVFESATDEQFLQCWALSNLRPLWALDNWKKNSLWNGVRAFRRITAS